MHLILADCSPMDTRFIDGDGRTVYISETPNKVFNRVTRVQKILTDKPVLAQPQADLGAVSPGATEPAMELEDSFTWLGTIEWHSQYANLTVDVSGIPRTGPLEWVTTTRQPEVQRFSSTAYFRNEGWGWFGRHRVFTAPDGKDYRWMLGPSTCSLVLHSPSGLPATPIAELHMKKADDVTKENSPYLEIYPEGLHIKSLIVVTCIFIDSVRREQEIKVTEPVKNQT